MTHKLTHASLTGFAVGLVFAVVAWALRAYGRYPVCHNDEVNWIDIAAQLDLGVHWPVSGPAFIETVRLISEEAQIKHVQSISLLGIGCVFLSIVLLFWGYRKFALAAPGMVLAALALSSFFWAPLVESRPQQWGQMLVFVGVICAWLWLHRQGGWMFFLIVPCIAVTHILSHAILIFLCAVLVLADFMERRPITQRHLAVLIALFVSLGIYLLPQGPYAAMMADLEHAQFKRMLAGSSYLLVLPVVLVASLICAQRRWHWRPSWTDAVSRTLERQRTAIALSLLCLVLTALTMQAYLLPAEAWLPYKGSWWRFVLVQSGNLMFAAFFVLGIFGLSSGIRSGVYHPRMGRLLILLLIALGLLSSFAIAASWWMLHTNWFLRVLNYGIFFAAIVSAIGIQSSTRNWSRHARWALLAFGTLASLIAVVRPPDILGC